MLKSLLGIHTIDTGIISFDGRVYSDMSADEKGNCVPKIGMVFQGSALFDSMTVEENIGFPLKMFSNKNTKEIKERVDFVIDRVKLINAHTKKPSEISGGMRSVCTLPGNCKQPTLPFLRRTKFGTGPGNRGGHR